MFLQRVSSAAGPRDSPPTVAPPPKQVLLEGERLGATLERRIFEPVDSVDELCWQAYPREQREEENPPMVTRAWLKKI